MSAADTQTRIRVGVSSCLVGHEVRYDGGHKRDRYLTDVLARWFEFVPLCPEVGIGLPIPRPPIRLTGDPRAPRVVGVDDPGLDVTARLRDYAEQAAKRCADFDGYLFKSRSPSCGLARVKVYGAHGQPVGAASGAYAAGIVAALPNLPVEEEGRLNDPVLRENFITRVFTHHRWRRATAAGVRARTLVEFHSRHKYLVLAHSERHYRELGRLVADAGRGDPAERGARYLALLMAALGHRATRRRHSNVLQHLMGYLKRVLDGGDKAELAATIDEYRRGQVPLVVPMRLLRHHFRRNPDPFVEFQHYLEPYPEELMLRNAI